MAQRMIASGSSLFICSRYQAYHYSCCRGVPVVSFCPSQFLLLNQAPTHAGKGCTVNRVQSNTICTTIGARVVPTRSSSIRGDRFIKTFQAALAFAGAAAWDKPRSKYGVQLHPVQSPKQVPTRRAVSTHEWLGGTVLRLPATFTSGTGSVPLPREATITPKTFS